MKLIKALAVTLVITVMLLFLVKELTKPINPSCASTYACK